MRVSIVLFALLGSASAAGCPYMSNAMGGGQMPANHPHVARGVEEDVPEVVEFEERGFEPRAETTAEFLAQFEIDEVDADDFLTSDVGGPIEDQQSLSAGERGPTLLEDFIFRQKIQHFDHERVSLC